MITIVQIDDEKRDLEKTSACLCSLGSFLTYELIQFSSLDSGLSYIQRHLVDLVLLELEFTVGSRSAIFAVDKIDPAIPIIVVSHLSHYQRQLQLKANVAGFVPKARMEEQLVRSVLEVLSAKNAIPSPTQFTIPPGRSGQIGQTFDLEDILWIKVDSFKKYTIQLTKDRKVERESVSFTELCERIKKERITILEPISRSMIININYISEVTIQRNGRACLSLIGQKAEFRVGKNYQERFRNWYT